MAEIDNTVFVLQKAIKKFKIKVSNSTIKEFLMAHPYYPTLKSVCDALKKWNVEYYPLKLGNDEIKALGRPFIAHLDILGGQLIFIEEIKNGIVVFYENKNEKLVDSFDNLAGKISGAVIVLEGNKHSGEKEYTLNRQNEILNKSLLPFGILAVLFFTFSIFFFNNNFNIQYNYTFGGLVVTKLAGLTASLLLILHELKVNNPLADKICSFTLKTDCDSVLSSSASKVFGWLNWADAGLIYFAGTIIYLLGSIEKSSFGILFILSFVSLPYPVFSIYYQSVKLKKWCPFCLIVQLVLIAEFVLLFPVLKIITISEKDILLFFVSFLLPAAIWLIYNRYYYKSEKLTEDHNALNQFKRNPDIFRFLIQKNGYINFTEDKSSIVVGNPEAPITLTAFLSLYCNPCAKAFKQLKFLLHNCPSEVKIKFIFSVYNDEESQKLINLLYYLYKEKGQESALTFLDNWYSNVNRISNKFINNKLILKQYNIAQQIKEKNNALFKKYQILGTPTVYVNGYKFPDFYDYNDIENYTDEIKLLNQESKRQEACANCD
ncbi:MAG: thioredoxin domain-containing protein [Bacteroidetes bacterium]|nr:thioredoxin domain-containing protein [Bacteroidota bacterium]